MYTVDNIEIGKVAIRELASKAKSKILDLAIRGQLVPQNPDDEPASVLLERIRASFPLLSANSACHFAIYFSISSILSFSVLLNKISHLIRISVPISIYKCTVSIFKRLSLQWQCNQIAIHYPRWQNLLLLHLFMIIKIKHDKSACPIRQQRIYTDYVRTIFFISPADVQRFSSRPVLSIFYFHTHRRISFLHAVSDKV